MLKSLTLPTDQPVLPVMVAEPIVTTSNVLPSSQQVGVDTLPSPRGEYAQIKGANPALPAAKTLEALERFRDQTDLVDATGPAPLGRLGALANSALGALTALSDGVVPEVRQAARATYEATRSARARLEVLRAAPETTKAVRGAALLLDRRLASLEEACEARGASKVPGTGESKVPDIGRPASTLPRFDVQKYWDADSTPSALASLSRAVGGVAPRSGGRTPVIEAAIVMASLMHDVAYYYGGWSSDRERADELFGAQIPYFAAKLDPEAIGPAKVAAAVDVAAVRVGGGVPFKEGYSWSYGFEPSQRGYATLDPGQLKQVQQISRETFREVVGQIAAGQFHISEVLAAKLGKASPEYQEEVKANIVKLCQALQRDFERGADLPGF